MNTLSRKRAFCLINALALAVLLCACAKTEPSYVPAESTAELLELDLSGDGTAEGTITDLSSLRCFTGLFRLNLSNNAIFDRTDSEIYPNLENKGFSIR